MNALLRKLVDLREGEGARAAFMIGYIYLIIFSYLILKPMTRSLFVKNLGPEQLPFAYMLVALVVGIVAVLYARLAAKIRLDRLINGTTIFLMSNLLLFWWLLTAGIKSPFLYFGLWIWASIYGVLTVSQFWLLANYVFNPREAKRIFPLLAAAAIAGGISGGYFTRAVVKQIGGTANLWSMQPDGTDHQQHTRLGKWDARYPSMGPGGRIAFMLAGDIHLFDQIPINETRIVSRLSIVDLF